MNQNVNLMKGVMNLLYPYYRKLNFSTESYVLLGLSLILPLLLFMEMKLNFDVMRYKNIRFIFACSALAVLLISYLLPVIKRNLHHIVTAFIYILTSHAIFLNYVNNFSFYYAALLVGTVTMCSFYFDGWKHLLVYQLSMLLMLLQASLLSADTNVNIMLFFGFYVVMNCIVVCVQTYLFHKQRELEKLTSQLENAALHLKETNRSLEQFAYIASHDLKEPLRTVNSYLGLLKKRYKNKLDADADEFITMCTDATKRMQELIDGLLKYSRTSAEKMDNTEINLNEVVETVLDDLEVAITENHANIRVQNLPVLTGDKLQLSQLFQNLISNALKYRSEQAPEIVIQYNGTEGDHAVISIEDNGLGIPETQKDEVFKLFNRYHTENADGAGLGLAICKKIVTNHKGNIWVETPEGRGSRFCFTLMMN